VLAHSQVRQAFARFLDALSAPGRGTSARIGRAILLAEPPSLDVGEVTDKGSINQRAVLAHRATLVEELYADPPSANVIVAPALVSRASPERPGWGPTAQAS
jgi:feruloyl-CoA synthase